MGPFLPQSEFLITSDLLGPDGIGEEKGTWGKGGVKISPKFQNFANRRLLRRFWPTFHLQYFSEMRVRSRPSL